MPWQVTSSGKVYDADEGPVIYFDPNSGDTHLLTEFSAYIMDQLAQQPMSSDALRTALTPLVDENNPGDLIQLIAQVMEELVALDIVKRV